MNERNLIDQKETEIEVFRKHKIKSMRISMSELKDCFANGTACLDSKTGKFTLKSNEIGLVYYR